MKWESSKHMSNGTSGSLAEIRREAGEEWLFRMKSLVNIPPVLKMVWDAAPLMVSASLVCRFVAALTPLAMLAVTRFIIDAINGLASHHVPLPASFWWLVGLEFGLATLAMV